MTRRDIWQEIEKIAKECQKTWGMGFPVISLTLLKPLFEEARKQAEETESPLSPASPRNK